MPSLKEYCNIHIYIKKTNPALFQLLEDTCTEHIFKYRMVTFLMPNDTLIAKIKKEKPSVAAKLIKSLVLKGTFKSSSDLKGDVFSIVGKLTNASSLKVKPDTAFVQWDGFDNLSVLLYDGASVPENIEQERKAPVSKKVVIGSSPKLKKKTQIRKSKK